MRIEVDKLDVKDDVDFTQKLLTEENVFVLPGTIFQAPGYVRLVVCSPIEKLKIACDRMEAFCRRHRKSWTNQRTFIFSFTYLFVIISSFYSAMLCNSHSYSWIEQNRMTIRALPLLHVLCCGTYCLPFLDHYVSKKKNNKDAKETTKTLRYTGDLLRRRSFV